MRASTTVGEAGFANSALASECYHIMWRNTTPPTRCRRKLLTALISEVTTSHPRQTLNSAKSPWLSWEYPLTEEPWPVEARVVSHL